jgi:uncharacterized DUF497 family protein
MDIYFEQQGIRFVWHEEKGRTNTLRHDGITFEQATEAFFDPFLKVLNASRNEEARDAIVGMDTCRNLLFVVHIEIEAEEIRLISARKATRKERMDYEN